MQLTDPAKVLMDELEATLAETHADRARWSHRRSPALLDDAKRAACPDPEASTARTDQGLADARLVRTSLTAIGAAPAPPAWAIEFAAGREARATGCQR